MYFIFSLLVGICRGLLSPSRSQAAGLYIDLGRERLARYDTALAETQLELGGRV
jgi:hypothetical protein